MLTLPGKSSTAKDRVPVQNKVVSELCPIEPLTDGKSTVVNSVCSNSEGTVAERGDKLLSKVTPRATKDEKTLGKSILISVKTSAEVVVVSEPLTVLSTTSDRKGSNSSHVSSEDLLQGQGKSVEVLCKENLEEMVPAGSPSGTEVSSSSDSQGDGLFSTDTNPIRVSQRKRKPPATLDDNPSPPSLGGWVRIALGLLERVSRFRGVNREKGELNAASWFTRPVDPLEAPDYYTIVKNPMDFSTIRKRLESGYYTTMEDFHSDMSLVRDNCGLYNPLGSSVQRDCQEVFAFYTQEYEKIVGKLNKSRVPSATSSHPSAGKKLKIDKVPAKS
ncbi:SWR1 complex bromodomain subunit bdf1-like [Octopus sinensis]|uniref:SWR1 complex bromodomain subunit bdf1-like n=1 Tax=Octopus sinensis TaxID=2607531 RepID=A0A7E6FID2_9MOLL|nr:SWR1 complex bromodomain subunit bdf1-like [Octopus sinensis]